MPFAVPLVSAAAAILRAERPGLSAPQLEAALRDIALDPGDPGLVPDFGAGLLQPGALCGGGA